MVSYIERAISWLSDHHNELYQEQTENINIVQKHLEGLYEATS